MKSFKTLSEQFQTFMRYFLVSVDKSDVVKGANFRRQTTVNAQNLTINQRSHC